jgi:hypothetical protein
MLLLLLLLLMLLLLLLLMLCLLHCLPQLLASHPQLETQMVCSVGDADLLGKKLDRRQQCCLFLRIPEKCLDPEHCL